MLDKAKALQLEMATVFCLVGVARPRIYGSRYYKTQHTKTKMSTRPFTVRRQIVPPDQDGRAGATSTPARQRQAPRRRRTRQKLAYSVRRFRIEGSIEARKLRVATQRGNPAQSSTPLRL